MQPTLVFKTAIAQIIFLLFFSVLTFADREPFYPSWKHLNSESKRLYISGYLHGLRDTEEIVKIARDYIAKNPTLATQTLEKVEKICSVSDMSPGAIAPEIDAYYSDIANQQAALSLALSTAQQRIRSTTR